MATFAVCMSAQESSKIVWSLIASIDLNGTFATLFDRHNDRYNFASAHVAVSPSGPWQDVGNDETLDVLRVLNMRHILFKVSSKGAIWTLYFRMSCSPDHRILKKAVLSSKIKCSLAYMTLFLCLCSLLVFVLNQMWDELTHPLFASYYLKKKTTIYLPTLLIFVMKGQTNNFFLA